MVIEVPPKIWKPKVVNKFRVPDNSDLDDGVFDFTNYGKCVFKPKGSWDPGTRNDIILFDSSVDSKELLKDLKLGAGLSN